MIDLNDVISNGEFIDSGGAGQVYKYSLPESRYGLSINSPVAVKIYSSKLVKAIPTQLDRMRREFEVGIRIEHPNIVKTYDFGSAEIEGETTFYLVMEYLEGGTLKEYVNENHPLSHSEVMRAFEHIVCGLKELHGKGLVHRDLKPENILVDPVKPEFKISDFGVVADKSALTMTSHGVFLGTIRYAAAEYLNSATAAEYDARIDLCSLGLCLYFLISNQ